MGPSLDETFGQRLIQTEVEEMIVSIAAYNIANHDLLVKEFDGCQSKPFEILKEKGFKLGIVTTKIL